MDASFAKVDGRYTLTLERRLAHPPEKVWRVLTERELLKQWFPADIEGGWEVGASLRFTFLHGEGDGMPEEDLRGEVMRMEPPNLLEFRWGKGVIRAEVTADGDGSFFRFSETLDDPSWGARNAAGWEMCFDSLETVLQGGALAKFAWDVWRAKFTHYVAKFEPLFGPQQGPPENIHREEA